MVFFKNGLVPNRHCHPKKTEQILLVLNILIKIDSLVYLVYYKIYLRQMLIHTYHRRRILFPEKSVGFNWVLGELEAYILAIRLKKLTRTHQKMDQNRHRMLLAELLNVLLKHEIRFQRLEPSQIVKFIENLFVFWIGKFLSNMPDI